MGFEPITSGLWPQRAANCSTPLCILIHTVLYVNRCTQIRTADYGFGDHRVTSTLYIYDFLCLQNSKADNFDKRKYLFFFCLMDKTLRNKFGFTVLCIMKIYILLPCKWNHLHKMEHIGFEPMTYTLWECRSAAELMLLMLWEYLYSWNCKC